MRNCESTSVQGRTQAPPADVYLLGILGILAAVLEVAAILFGLLLGRGRGDLFFNVLWVSSGMARSFLRGGFAVYYLVSAVGLLRLRAYGYWMLVGIVALEAATLPLWWLWGRHFVVGTGAEPPGFLWLLIRLVWCALLAGWCFWRRQLFVGHGIGGRSGREDP